MLAMAEGESRVDMSVTKPQKSKSLTDKCAYWKEEGSIAFIT